MTLGGEKDVEIPCCCLLLLYYPFEAINVETTAKPFYCEEKDYILVICKLLEGEHCHMLHAYCSEVKSNVVIMVVIIGN